MKRRILSTLLTAAMLTGLLTACGTGSEENVAGKESAAAPEESGGNSAEAESEQEELEPITITMGTIVSANWNDYPDNSVANYIRDKFGITIEGFEWGERKAALMASGDLPDVFIIEKTEIPDLIESGFVLPLDDLIDKYGSHIFPNEDVISAQRKDYYDGEHIYGLTMNYVELSDGSLWTGNFGLNVDWERYAQLGYPEVENDVDSIYKFLTDMVALKPATDDGLPVYAIEYPIWGAWGWQIAPTVVSGKFHSCFNGIMAVDLETGDLVKAMSDPDSYMWQWSHMYFKLYQDGLIDPDSFTGNDSIASQKAANGQYAAQLTHLTTGAANSAYAQEGLAEGFQYIPVKGSTAWCGGDYSYGGGNVRCISSKTEHPERIMQLLDWMYSPEGTRILFCGLEGETWNYEDGVPTLTDEAVAAYQAQDGSMYDYGLGMNWNLGARGKAEDGYNVNLFLEMDYLKRSQTPLEKAVEEHYGMTMKEKVDAMVADGSMVDQSGAHMRIMNMMGVLPEDLSLIAGECANVINEGLAQCITANSEDDYFRLRDELIARIKDMGIEQVEEWYSNEYNRVKEELEK